MKKLFLFIFLIIIILNTVSSVPQLPTGYEGTLYDTLGRPVESKEIEIKDIYQVLVGKATTNSQGFYVITVIWDDPETPGDEGVTVGDTINFYVDSIKMKSVIVGEQGESYLFDFVLIEEERQNDYSYSSINPIRTDSIKEIDETINDDLIENKTSLNSNEKIDEKTEDKLEKTNLENNINTEDESKKESVGDLINSKNKKTGFKLIYVLYIIIMLLIIYLLFKILKKREVLY